MQNAQTRDGAQRLTRGDHGTVITWNFPRSADRGKSRFIEVRAISPNRREQRAMIAKAALVQALVECAEGGIDALG